MADDIDLDCVADLKALMGERYAQLVETYLRSNGEYVVALSERLSEEDLKGVFDAAHTMKSASANMGFVGLGAAAEALEVEVRRRLDAGEGAADLEKHAARIESLFEDVKVFLNAS